MVFHDKVMDIYLPVCALAVTNVYTTAARLDLHATIRAIPEHLIIISSDAFARTNNTNNLCASSLCRETAKRTVSPRSPRNRCSHSSMSSVFVRCTPLWVYFRNPNHNEHVYLHRLVPSVRTCSI